MEYNIKIELLDAKDGKVVASTTMSEEHAKSIRRIHEVDVLLDTVDIMKGGIQRVADADRVIIPEGIMQRANESNKGGPFYSNLDIAEDKFPNIMEEIDISLERDGDVTTGTFEDPVHSFIAGIQEAIDKRRGQPQDEFWPWIESDVPVMKEDVQDYMTFFGVSSEVAYERIKKYAIGEVDEIEAENDHKDLTSTRTTLTKEQIAEVMMRSKNHQEQK